MIFFCLTFALQEWNGFSSWFSLIIVLDCYLLVRFRFYYDEGRERGQNHAVHKGAFLTNNRLMKQNLTLTVYLPFLTSFQLQIKWFSMARANLNKSVVFLTNTTAVSKYITRRPRININWNPPFQTSLHKIFKNCFYDVNLVSQCSHLQVFLLSKFGSERGVFNWCRLWAF